MRAMILLAVFCVLVAAAEVGGESQSLTLLIENFDNGVDGNFWKPFGAYPGNPGANDSNAQVSVTADGGTLVSIQPLTLTIDQSGPAPGQELLAGLDHVKYLVFSGASYDVSNPRSTTTWTLMLKPTLDLGRPPFPKSMMSDPQQDMRLLAAGGKFASLAECLIADFWLTNTALYALYERLPFCNGWNATNKVYHAFTAVKKMASVVPGQRVTVSIAYDATARNIVFWVEGVQAEAVINTLGVLNETSAPGFKTVIDHGGPPDPMWPSSVKAGFGIINLLDAADPVTPDPAALPNGEPLPGAIPENPNGKLEALVQLNGAPGFYADRMTFLDKTSRLRNRLWGQGAAATFYRLTVKQRVEVDK